MQHHRIWLCALSVNALLGCSSDGGGTTSDSGTSDLGASSPSTPDAGANELDALDAGGHAPADATPEGDAAPESSPDASPNASPDATAATKDGDATSGAADASACAQCTGPGDWSAGDYPPDLNAQTYLAIEGVKGQGDSVRGYKVHVPQGYDPDVGAPLLFALHGLGQNAVMFAVDGAAWPAKADREGFILVMPTGNVQNDDGSWGTVGSWNAGECCGGAATSEVDDVALIRAIAKEVGTHLNVDMGRVYATGLSNGGFLSYRLACEAADLFVAVAPGSGAIGTPTLAPLGAGNESFTTCDPSQPVAVLAMHGTSDPLVPYAYVKPSLDHMAEANGCDATTAPAAIPMSVGDATCITYTGCPDGVEVSGCSVQDGGHCWFGNETCGTGDTTGIGNTIVGNNSDAFVNTDAAWAFLKRFSR